MSIHKILFIDIFFPFVVTKLPLDETFKAYIAEVLPLTPKMYQILKSLFFVNNYKILKMDFFILVSMSVINMF
jgi:hypothetical protein